MSLDSITGPGFDTSLIPDGVMEILQSGGYKLILANSSYKTGTDAINNQLTEMNGLIKAVDPVADVDFKNVNVWSILAVLAIIAISFKSISIPVLLVASIEAAIAINMGIPYFTGTLHPDDHPLPRGARLWPHPEGSRPAVAGALQPVHPDQRPDLLCRHRRRGRHQ